MPRLQAFRFSTAFMWRQSMQTKWTAPVRETAAHAPRLCSRNATNAASVKVSFLSVTQAFNTTTSMGRLTLNVLLSFAQFEREVTGERIRDKIAALRAKGMWMGGTLPPGYDPPTDATRALIVNDAEAATVRLMFTTYLELGSVHALQRWLAARGIVSKARVTRGGCATGGLPFSRGRAVPPIAQSDLPRAGRSQG